MQQSGRVDLNHRPPGPEPGALTGLRYAPNESRLNEVLMRPEGVEPPAFWSVAKRSIQLSYGRGFQSVLALDAAVAEWAVLDSN